MQHDTHVKDASVKQDLEARQRSDLGGEAGGGRKPEPGRNKGEGNPEAAARFNKAEQEFVNSARGQKKISEAGDVRPDEEAQLEEAERTTRSLPKDAGTKDKQKS
jgi:hypothetical protein